jgi:iron uptake system component EfeO
LPVTQDRQPGEQFAMPRYRLTAYVGAGALALSGLAACDGKGAKREKIAVTATDTECKVSKTELSAGTHTFAVANKGSKVTEFYVYAHDGRIKGEVENISPGVSRDVSVELAAGEYQGACKPGMVGGGIRVPLTVSGESTALASDPKLAAAVATYKAYVSREADALLAGTTAFVAAVKAGDGVRAKALFPTARSHWERIEPVAESFGDLDPAIDARENDVATGQEWTGFHKIEKDLWTTGDITRDGPVADKLLVDVKEIVTRSKAVELSPAQLANGSKELLDEVATGKITGEEDRYSHTDLWDFAANLDGSKMALESLRDALSQRDPALVADLDVRFPAVAAALERHKVGEGWKSYTDLTPGDLKDLSDAINGLAEPISRVAG